MVLCPVDVGATTPPPAPRFPRPGRRWSIQPGTRNAQELFGRKSLAELNAERPLADVFFDLDTPMIRDDAKALLVANANWARTWGEHHADDRRLLR